MKTEVMILIVVFLLFIAAIVWLDRRNQQRFQKSRAFYGEDSEEWLLNGVKAPAEMVSLMLGRYGVQMQQTIETSDTGKVTHHFVTVNAKSLPSA